MTIQCKRSVHYLGGLALLLVLLAALAGCGAPTPEPQVMVVTATYTPTPQVVVVTATYTPTPLPTETAVPTQTPVPTNTAAPTLTPEPAEPAVAYVPYEHPSGAFGVDIPADVEVREGEDNLVYFYEDSVFMITFTQLDVALGTADLEEMIPIIVDSALVGEGLIDSYDGLETTQIEGGAGDAVVAAGSFGMTSGLIGDGKGGIILIEHAQTLYIQILVTPDPDAVEDVWERTFETMWAVPFEIEAQPEAPSPAPPSPTVAPPTSTPKPTAKPQPQPTNTSPPPPTANKGCYLFQNFLDAEVTITFTARDWEWSDTLAVAAGEEKEYCLDPGRYTYTLDAPPPWGSTNGELTVAAGDKFLWPIRGR